ncbi:MAG: BlaI/MecI/CopY family transcriptional regulator [Gemmatimonadota bacterium]|nr:MAG: BlaI/MecI/CopY family transcriptional regulator [Gemmatimonadota bacterium]
MSQPDLGDLGRRERQIVEALYRLERATVRDVLAELPDPPSYSSVRAMLTKLEEKGYARHEQDGPRYVYLPVVPAERARRTALRHLVDTFFEGSAERAALALIKLSDAQISDEALERLAELVRRAEQEGR